MQIQHHQGEKKGSFFYETSGNRLAEMTYIFAGSQKIIIDHTEVDESLRGQGVGFQLVEASVNFAREKNLKILPLCPFAKAVFDKTETYHDVLF